VTALRSICSQGIIIPNLRDGAHDAAGGHHHVAVLQFGKHLLLLLLLPLHGQEEQKIEDSENQEDGQEAHERVVAAWLL